MLKIVRRGEKGIFQIVGTCPLTGERIRESTGLVSERHAEAKRVQLEARLLDEATYGKRQTATFAAAVTLYRQKGRPARFLGPLIHHFGMKRMGSIADLDLTNFAALHYPNARPQTLDRQVYTPMIAVWRCAHVAGLCGPHEFTRPKKPEPDAIRFARDEDVLVLLPHCWVELKAALLLLTFTGARASEACRLEDRDVDWAEGKALFRKTKSGKPRVVALAPIVLEALLPLRGRQGPLMGFANRWSLNRALARACKAAGLPVMASHALGRHAFAARLLRRGHTLKEVQEAGGWSAKSFPLVAAIYGHLERSAVDAAVRSADTSLVQALRESEHLQGKTAA